MKTLSELSSGTRASKASWQFQRVFIPDSTLAISMEYPALCSRAVLKAGLWDSGKDEVKTPHLLGFGLEKEIAKALMINVLSLIHI